MSIGSKVIARTDRQTDKQTDKQTDTTKTLPLPHTREVNMLDNGRDKRERKDRLLICAYLSDLCICSTNYYYCPPL